MKLKKVTAILLTAIMTVSLAACGSSSDGSSDSSGDSGEDAGAGGTYTIGICQQMEHAALDAATEGFQDACRELFGEENVEFDVQNAQGEQNMCSTIINNFVSSDVDLILAQIEMNRQLIATELAAANNAYAQGQGILQGYGSYLDQTTRDTLQYYLDLLEDAIEAEDKALLDAYTPPVQQLNSQIINALNSGAYGIVQ